MKTIEAMLRRDKQRMRLLQAVRALQLPDCFIAAGFVRNMVWDALQDNGKEGAKAGLEGKRLKNIDQYATLKDNMFIVYMYCYCDLYIYNVQWSRLCTEKLAAAISWVTVW